MATATSIRSLLLSLLLGQVVRGIYIENSKSYLTFSSSVNNKIEGFRALWPHPEHKGQNSPLCDDENLNSLQFPSTKMVKESTRIFPSRDQAVNSSLQHRYTSGIIQQGEANFSGFPEQLDYINGTAPLNLLYSADMPSNILFSKTKLAKFSQRSSNNREKRDASLTYVKHRKLLPKETYLPEWGELVSSSGPVAAIVGAYLRSCSLAIFYEVETASVAHVLRRSIEPMACKLYLLTPGILLQESTWSISQCDGYIVLLSSKGYFTQHAAIDHYFQTSYNGSKGFPPHYWNYRARFILILLNPVSYLNISSSPDSVVTPKYIVNLYNFKKTENLLILQSSRNSTLIWTNVLFSEHSIIRLIDKWSRGKFLKGQNLFPDKFGDLQGTTLKVSTFELAPSVVYDRDSAGLIKRRLGVDMGIVSSLAQAKNFTVEFTEISSNEKWGTKGPNGKWDGLMGDVLYEHVDFGICNAFVDYLRWLEVDYSFPYNFMPACFIAPSPKPLINWQSPLLPFAMDTWISVIAFMLVSGTILYIISQLSLNAESEHFRSIPFDYLSILGSVTLHGMVTEPRYGPTRLYLGFIWLFCLIITTAYSANLIAFLSVVKMTRPIDTVEQLVTSGLRIGGYAFWKTQFAEDTAESLLALASKLESNIDFFKVFNDVEKGTFAFVENRQFLELQQEARFTYSGYSTIRIGKQCLMNFNVGIILPRKSPLTRIFTRELQSVFESGIMRKWKEEVVNYFRQEFHTKLSSKTIERVNAKPLTLTQLQGMFLLLGCGYGIALMILIMEIIVKKNLKNDMEVSP